MVTHSQVEPDRWESIRNRVFHRRSPWLPLTTLNPTLRRPPSALSYSPDFVTKIRICG